MVNKRPRAVPFGRRRRQQTDYRKRLSLLKSRLPRVVIRISNARVIMQIVEFLPDGDKVLLSVNSAQLASFGWKHGARNMPAAYLTGYLLGKRAKVEDCIIDTGLMQPLKGSVVYAAIKGAVDAGLNVRVSEEIFPSEDRALGAHIAQYAESLKKDNEQAYNKVFSGVMKNGGDPTQIKADAEAVRSKLQ